MRELALTAIGVYQRYVSPHKGFCCAYRARTGRASCSALGARAIRRWGLRRGLAVLKLRLRRCGEVYRECRIDVPLPRLATASQRGHCDVDLGLDDGCCDAADVCDCGGCDWPSRQSRQEGAQLRRKPDKTTRWNAATQRWEESPDANVEAGRRQD